VLSQQNYSKRDAASQAERDRIHTQMRVDKFEKERQEDPHNFM